jgi:hypothetical protein
MPNFFITEMSPGSGSPKLYIAQGELETVVDKLKKWYQSSARFQVFELRVVEKNAQFNPQGCSTLALVATIEPHDVCEHHRILLGCEIEKLPLEQAELEIQRTIDFLQQKKTKVENGSNVKATAGFIEQA